MTCDNMGLYGLDEFGGGHSYGGFGGSSSKGTTKKKSTTTRKPRAKKASSSGSSRPVKHGDYNACVRGVNQHRGKPLEDARKICASRIR